MKIIKVVTCNTCPYCYKDSGMGFCGSYTKCDKFGIMLQDEDGPEHFDIISGIHPDCKLEADNG